MPLKRGGGNHMQLYDSRNGEYTDREKQNMRSYDNSAMSSYEWYGQNALRKFHFPVQGVHEKEYCNRFIRAVVDDIDEPAYDHNKMNYLLTFREKNDKSKFLKCLGYSEYRPHELFYDICIYTKRDSICFSRFSCGEMLVEAKTILKGHLVKTIWRLEKNLKICFVTLIPGGDKLWKK